MKLLKIAQKTLFCAEFHKTKPAFENISSVRLIHPPEIISLTSLPQKNVPSAVVKRSSMYITTALGTFFLQDTRYFYIFDWVNLVVIK